MEGLQTEILNKLKNRLTGNLPGFEAQFIMAPEGRSKQEHIYNTAAYRPSAVMIVFCTNKNGEMFIPLIERSSYNGVHSGQVSFPGGKFDVHDGELSNTALRECYEEIGIKGVEVIGSLTELGIPVSNFKVRPFVGLYKPVEPEFTVGQREVKTLIRLMVSELMRDGNVKLQEIKLANGTKIKAPCYDVNGQLVWGATAMILSELKEILKSISL